MTHINGEAITGLQHVQVIALMVDKKNSVITVNSIPLEQTSIRKDKRKRAPSLGHRVGKLLRHRSSGSGRIKKRPSFFKRLRRDKSGRGLENSSHSTSSTPSPKHPSSPHRTDSFKDRMSRLMSTDRRRRQTPVSPLARSTSPVGVAHNVTPNSSPPGSMHNISTATPPTSPISHTRRPERHSMFVDSQLLVHQKSYSVSELTPPSKKTSPHTSPLLKRAMSPSERKNKPRRSITLPREGREVQTAYKKKTTSIHLTTPERMEETQIEEGMTKF